VTRWRLAPLLAVRLCAEETAAAGRARALADLQAAERTVEAARERASAAGAPGGALPGSVAEVRALARFGRRLDTLVRDSVSLAEVARSAAERARAKHVAARRDRQALEILRRRWEEERRRRLAAAEDERLEAIAATWPRHHGAARPR
jgi:flagellar export protein FliJ